jgi:hypothetical protein
MVEGPLGGPRPFAEPEGWRAPTDEEMEMIDESFDDPGLREYLEDQNRVAVKDEFVSITPPYVGPMIVVLRGFPSAFRVFAVQEGELTEFRQEEQE